MNNPTSALVIVKNNGYGLTKDAELLSAVLADIGFTVDVARPGPRGWLQRPLGRRRYDVAFHLERAFPEWRRFAPLNLLFPNQERFPRRHLGRLRGIDAVLTKTAHAKAIFAELGANAIDVGFLSRDLFDETVKKDWRGVMHLAGASTAKGTEDILAIWARHPEWPELVLVQKRSNLPARLPANVRPYADFISDEALRGLMNRCGIHLCPSRSEGWGHYIHEAAGCGAVAITTDAPPMNEFLDADSGVLVPVCRQEPRHLGTNYFVDPKALEAAIEDTLRTEPRLLEERGQRARQGFLEIRAAFPARLAETLSQVSNGAIAPSLRR